MIDLNTKYMDYITFIKNDNAYCAGFGKLEKVYGWENKNLTFKEVMDDYIKNEKDWILNEHWANWSLNRFGKEFCEEIRAIFISKIIDSISLYIIYKDCDFVTAGEKTILKEKFEDKLPEVKKLLTEVTK